MLRVTIKHYFDFKGISNAVDEHVHSAQAWDALWLEPAESAIFAFPQERKEWLKRCQEEPFAKDRAVDIARVVKGDFKRVNSYASGPGYMEFFLKRECPDVFLQCSDYAPKSVERLRQVFTEADEVIQFDLANGGCSQTNDQTLHLLFRTDTILDNEQWHGVFQRMHSKGAKHVLFIPWEFLTVGRWLRQKIKFVLWPLLGRKLTFAGFVRSRAQLIELFSTYYAIEKEIDIAGNLKGFLLTPKGK
jgi:hypothetical protein